MEIHILIVEDDKSMIDSYTRSIYEYNKEKEGEDISIVADVKDNIKKALQAIEESSYEGAIVDIKLSGEKEGEGNQILHKIKDNLRFPVCIITGFPENIDDELRKQNIFWKIYKRDGVSHHEVLDGFVEICRTGILKILGNQGKLEKYLKKIFWEHLAEHFEEIMRYSSSNDAEKILIRYISAYLLEYMDINEAGLDETYVPPEFYIKPPVRDYLFTGDIIKNKREGNMYVIITPACDMVVRIAKNKREFRNAEKFLAAQLIFWEELDYVNSRGENKGKFSELLSDNNIKDTFKKYMRNKKERYHFIPPYQDIPASFIDFQSVISLTEDEINKSYERIATISGIFMRDIIARFSRYYARQGQPDLAVEKILVEMLSDGNSG